MKKILFVALFLNYCAKDPAPSDVVVDPNQPADVPAEAPPADIAVAKPDGTTTPLPPVEPTFAEADTTPVDPALTDEPIGPAAPIPYQTDKVEPKRAAEYSPSFGDGDRAGKKASKKFKNKKAIAAAELASAAGPQGEGKAKRYIKALQLNVRSKANSKSKIVRVVSRGDEVNVTYMGKWAKLANGEFIRTKHLTKTKVAPATPEEIKAAYGK